LAPARRIVVSAALGKLDGANRLGNVKDLARVGTNEAQGIRAAEESAARVLGQDGRRERRMDTGVDAAGAAEVHGASAEGLVSRAVLSGARRVPQGSEGREQA
jgi:hypothetical protein